MALRLEKAGLALGAQRWLWQPSTQVVVEGEVARKLVRLLEVIEDNDDVQAVHANFEIDDALLEELAKSRGGELDGARHLR